MKTIISVLLFYTLAKAETLKIVTDFEFKFGPRFDKSSSTLTAEVGKAWTQLAGSAKGVYVLGRVTSLENGKAQMEMIVFDSSKKEKSVISTPMIISKLDEKATIEVGDAGKKILNGDSFKITVSPSLMK